MKTGNDRGWTLAYIDGFGNSEFPDIRVAPNESDVYRPMAGYGHIMAVEGIDGSLIGWVPVEDLGAATVREWMERERYIVRSTRADRNR